MQAENFGTRIAHSAMVGLSGGDMLNWFSELWCRKMHRRAMWPIHGRYICQECLREYPVAWERPATLPEYADPSLRPDNMGLQTTVSLYQ
jgi:hypothetical protein